MIVSTKNALNEYLPCSPRSHCILCVKFEIVNANSFLYTLRIINTNTQAYPTPTHSHTVTILRIYTQFETAYQQTVNYTCITIINIHTYIIFLVKKTQKKNFLKTKLSDFLFLIIKIYANKHLSNSFCRFFFYHLPCVPFTFRFLFVLVVIVVVFFFIHHPM